jgi:hypothetical protein
MQNAPQAKTSVHHNPTLPVLLILSSLFTAFSYVFSFHGFSLRPIELIWNPFSVTSIAFCLAAAGIAIYGLTCRHQPRILVVALTTLILFGVARVPYLQIVTPVNAGSLCWIVGFLTAIAAASCYVLSRCGGEWTGLSFHKSAAWYGLSTGFFSAVGLFVNGWSINLSAQSYSIYSVDAGYAALAAGWTSDGSAIHRASSYDRYSVASTVGLTLFFAFLAGVSGLLRNKALGVTAGAAALIALLAMYGPTFFYVLTGKYHLQFQAIVVVGAFAFGIINVIRLTKQQGSNLRSILF